MITPLYRPSHDLYEHPSGFAFHCPFNCTHLIAFAIRSAVVILSVIADRLHYQKWTLPPVRFLYYNIVQSLATFYGSNRADYYLTEGLPLLLTTSGWWALVGLYQSVRPGPEVADDRMDRANQASYEGTIKQRIPHADISTLRADSVSHGYSTAVDSASAHGRKPENAPTEVRREPKTASSASHYTPCRPTDYFVLRTLSLTVIAMTTVLSWISHKEVRFLYPVLPFLHVLAAKPLSDFYQTSASNPRKSNVSHSADQHPDASPSAVPLWRKGIIGLLLSVNIIVAYYVGTVHQRGVIDILHHLRQEHEAQLIMHRQTSSHSGLLASDPAATSQPSSSQLKDSIGSVARGTTMTVGFLMPCHSTPWRSHLVHNSISAWALTCEPPLDIPQAARGLYLDEADVFYADPIAWLSLHMQSLEMNQEPKGEPNSFLEKAWEAFGQSSRRPWPDRLVFFAQLEDTMRKFLKSVNREDLYRECWRTFNTHWHDDWRRNGDVVVWCLNEQWKGPS
jgi:GPI mannosyltransferase 3